MKNVMIIGDKGMLGHIVKRYFETMPDKYFVVGLNRQTNHGFDAREDVNNINYDYDYIINCIGILNTSDDISLYSDVNVVFPKMLAQNCKENKAKLIHISTNCVFAGIGPHSPKEIPDATDLYGRSKAMGEINHTDHLTIRCSIIGTELKEEGTGLINQFITDPDFCTGFKNIFWNGITTLQLVKWMEQNLHKFGIVHYFSNTITDKFELLEDINRVFKLDKPVYPGYRDMHQSLLNGRNYTNKSYEQQLQELKDFNEGYDNSRD